MWKLWRFSQKIECVVHFILSSATFSWYYNIIYRINECSKRFNSNAAQSRYIIVSSIINSWNSIKVETHTDSFKFTGIFSIDLNIVLSNKLVRQSEEDLPAKSQNVMKFSNQLLTSDKFMNLLFNFLASAFHDWWFFQVNI